MTTETALGREIGASIAVLVVADVSGSGKSTVGEALAQMLGWPYSEADDFHPKSNIEKMSRGEPLTDADRAPWLATIADFIAGICARRSHTIVSCSALKHSYRATLVGTRRDRVRVVLLDGAEEEIAARLARRKGHFMPPGLLHSQFAALERPADEHDAILVPIGGTPDAVAAKIVEALRYAASTVSASRAQ